MVIARTWSIGLRRPRRDRRRNDVGWGFQPLPLGSGSTGTGRGETARHQGTRRCCVSIGRPKRTRQRTMIQLRRRRRRRRTSHARCCRHPGPTADPPPVVVKYHPASRFRSLRMDHRAWPLPDRRPGTGPRRDRRRSGRVARRRMVVDTRPSGGGRARARA